jgi:DNA-directed RNA polymerase subunit alpha
MSSLLNKNWNSLIKPSRVVSEGKTSSNVTSFVIEPLEKGFGLTIGNALRRILLSSLQGGAITGVKIPGVLHEFAAKSGVKEDIVDVVLNLKRVAIKMYSAEKKVIRLKASGPCVVTAGMIQTNADVDILNPDQVICTLSKDAELEMELFCETGKGYVAANAYNSEFPIGVIAIDALYSPVTKVSYIVEDTRVGQDTDYDKLTITITTNGSISPEMSLALSARILQDQLQLFITFEDDEEEEEEVQEELGYSHVLLKKIDELELSVRSRNCLYNDNIVYIGDLVVKTESEMMRTPNFGRKSLAEMKKILETYGLSFGMVVPNWPPENIEDLAKQYADSF